MYHFMHIFNVAFPSLFFISSYVVGFFFFTFTLNGKLSELKA